MVLLISEKLGSVYTLDPDDNDVLCFTPLNKDNTYSSNFEDYDEIDWLSIAGEEEYIGIELNRIHTLLRGDFYAK